MNGIYTFQSFLPPNADDTWYDINVKATSTLIVYESAHTMIGAPIPAIEALTQTCTHQKSKQRETRE